MTKIKKENSKKLHRFFYNNNIYIIDTARLKYVEDEFCIKISDLLSSSKTALLLKKNKISIKEFLEKVSACWISN